MFQRYARQTTDRGRTLGGVFPVTITVAVQPYIQITQTLLFSQLRRGPR